MMNRARRKEPVPSREPDRRPSMPPPGSGDGAIDRKSFMVAVRARPLNNKERQNVKRQRVHTLRYEDNMVFLMDPDTPDEFSSKKERVYAFDWVFEEHVNNTQVFQTAVLPLVLDVLDGVNATCFAYGMTGAGKTHTMLGNAAVDRNGEVTETEMGICLHSVNHMFDKIAYERDTKEFEVRVSYLEIYNEAIKDLLVPEGEPGGVSWGGGNANSLLIVEDPVKGVIVPDLSEFTVTNIDEVRELILLGNARRTMASTGSNQFSSRSHAILQITVQQKNKTRDIVEEVKSSKLSLIDLAGSERAAASDNRGQRQIEGANINRSLLALGNCINILGDKTKRGSFVPYRDSKLTRLLKDSLGGNTRTIMISCVSPSSTAYEETVNTLKYASRARNIERKVVRNVKEVQMHISRYKEIIESLKSEIEGLKTQLKHQQTGYPSPELMSNINSAYLHSDLSPIVAELSRTKEERDMLEAELEAQRRASLGFQSSVDEPIDDEDPQFMETVSKNLMNNFEEKMEVKQSIFELEELNSQNAKLMDRLKSDVENMQLQLEAYEQQRWNGSNGSNGIRDSIDGSSSREMYERLDKALDELNSLQSNMAENDKIRNQLIEALQAKEDDKLRLLDILARMRSGKRKDLLESQISIRQLKLEKLDLHTQNLEMKRQYVLAERDAQSKDARITQMEREIQRMRNTLEEKERLLREKTDDPRASTPPHNRYSTAPMSTIPPSNMQSSSYPYANTSSIHPPIAPPSSSSSPRVEQIITAATNAAAERLALSQRMDSRFANRYSSREPDITVNSSYSNNNSSNLNSRYANPAWDNFLESSKPVNATVQGPHQYPSNFYKSDIDRTIDGELRGRGEYRGDHPLSDYRTGSSGWMDENDEDHLYERDVPKATVSLTNPGSRGLTNQVSSHHSNSNSLALSAAAAVGSSYGNGNQTVMERSRVIPSALLPSSSDVSLKSQGNHSVTDMPRGFTGSLSLAEARLMKQKMIERQRALLRNGSTDRGNGGSTDRGNGSSGQGSVPVVTEVSSNSFSIIASQLRNKTLAGVGKIAGNNRRPLTSPALSHVSSSSSNYVPASVHVDLTSRSRKNSIHQPPTTASDSIPNNTTATTSRPLYNLSTVRLKRPALNNVSSSGEGYANAARQRSNNSNHRGGTTGTTRSSSRTVSGSKEMRSCVVSFNDAENEGHGPYLSRVSLNSYLLSKRTSLPNQNHHTRKSSTALQVKTNLSTSVSTDFLSVQAPAPVSYFSDENHSIVKRSSSPSHITSSPDFNSDSHILHIQQHLSPSRVSHPIEYSPSISTAAMSSLVQKSSFSTVLASDITMGTGQTLDEQQRSDSLYDAKVAWNPIAPSTFSYHSDYTNLLSSLPSKSETVATSL